MGKVQGIIIKDGKVLVTEGFRNSYKRNFFITGLKKEDETEIDAMKRELKEQLGIDYDITFKFCDECDLKYKMTTFLIDITEENIDIDYDIENINPFSDEMNVSGIEWVDLKDKRRLGEYIIEYLKLLLDQCIEAGYRSQWSNIIKERFFMDSELKQYLQKKQIKRNRIKVDKSITTGRKLEVIILAFIIGILFNYFFVSEYLGISVVIFNIALLSSAILSIYNKVNLNRKESFIFLIPIILLTLAFPIFNNRVLRFINILLLPFLMCGYILTIRYKGIQKIDINLLDTILSKTLIVPFNFVGKFLEFLKEIIKNKRKVNDNPVKKSIKKGIIISIPLLIIILILLTSADMMFSYYIENIFSGIGDFNIGSLIGNSIVILLVAIYMFGFLWSLKYEEYKDSKNIKIKAKVEPVTILTVIFMISIVYLLFSIVQFSYLYAGNTLPSGFTYSEYARRGFFELVLVTLINLAIIFMGIMVTKRGSNKVNKISNIAYSLIVIFTGNMLFSANYKMVLYETEFGFTRLRVFVQSFMVFIAIVLIIALITIWRRKTPIIKYSFIAAMVIYIGLNYINVDKIIVKENINRYYETQRLDRYYLTHLSPDASTEILKLLEGDKEMKNIAKEYIENKKVELNDYNRWYEYNYYKSKVLE